MPSSRSDRDFLKELKRKDKKRRKQKRKRKKLRREKGKVFIHAWKEKPSSRSTYKKKWRNICNFCNQLVSALVSTAARLQTCPGILPPPSLTTSSSTSTPSSASSPSLSSTLRRLSQTDPKLKSGFLGLRWAPCMSVMFGQVLQIEEKKAQLGFQFYFLHRPRRTLVPLAGLNISGSNSHNYGITKPSTTSTSFEGSILYHRPFGSSEVTTRN